MFHMSAKAPRTAMYHGDAPSRGRHRPSNPSFRGLSDLSNPNNLSLSSNRGPNPSSPNGPNDPSNRSNGNISDPRNLINGSDYSSEASSFIPSSIRDLSRNEKLSLIVLRWLPSG